MYSLSQLINSEFHNHNDTNIIYDKKNKLYCCNCGKYGHISKKCREPIISFGIINIFLNDEILFKLLSNKYVMENVINNYTRINYQIKNISLQKFNEKNNSNLNNLSNINEYIIHAKKLIKFLLIRRKHSVGYIEFIKGRYDELDDNNLLYILNQLTPDELNNIKENNFDKIWHEMWGGKYENIPLNEELLNETSEAFNNLSIKDQHIYTKIHLKEYNTSKLKFEYLKSNNIIDRLELEQKINLKYDEPEWGFPKGRRNMHENNHECAVREYEEETGLDKNNMTIMDRIYPITELLTGTNNIQYKHLYYLAFSKFENTVNLNLPSQKIEIGAIGWFYYDEVKTLIRPYHTNRLILLDEIIIFIAHNIKYYSNITN